MIFRNEFWFLSNMYGCEIEYKGKKYSCIESAFQAQKNPEQADVFTRLNGFEAKKMGRRVYLRRDWEQVKDAIMLDLIRIKFSKPYLREKLKNIKGPIIEENTWGDTYWGKCNGKGLNKLGLILEKVRNEL